MTTYAPGNSQSTFVARHTQDLRCICYQRGDRNVFIDGQGPYCLIIDREYEKIEIEDVGINSSMIEAIWLEADCLPIRKGSVIVSGGYEYKVKESPAIQHDGWVTAKLKLTCKCQ